MELVEASDKEPEIWPLSTTLTTLFSLMFVGAGFKAIQTSTTAGKWSEDKQHYIYDKICSYSVITKLCRYFIKDLGTVIGKQRKLFCCCLNFAVHVLCRQKLVEKLLVLGIIYKLHNKNSRIK